MPASKLTADLIPCRIVNWVEDQSTEGNLCTIVACFASHDDVWNLAFLAGKISYDSDSLYSSLADVCYNKKEPRNLS